MAHEIYFNKETQKHSVMLADEAAWHGLGQVVVGAQTWEETRKLAGLDYSVIKKQLECEGKLVPVWGIFRDDNQAFLGSVGAKYALIQNDYAFHFVDALLEAEDQAHYESAGALGRGERIWVMARVPFDFKVGGEDPHRTYLLFVTSHDGTLSAQAKLTTVRVVCANTMNQSLAMNGSFVKVRHTQDAENKLEQAKKMMSGARQSAKTLEEKLNALSDRIIDKEAYMKVLDRLFPTNEQAATQTRRDNVLLKVTELFEKNDGNVFPNQRGTALNLLNAVTNYVDHARPTRLTEARQHLTKEQGRIESAIFGSGELLKRSAIDIVLEETLNCKTKPESKTFGPLLEDIIANTSAN